MQIAHLVVALLLLLVLLLGILAIVALVTWVVKRVWFAGAPRSAKAVRLPSTRMQRILGILLFVLAGAVLVATVALA